MKFWILVFAFLYGAPLDDPDGPTSDGKKTTGDGF